jgi:glycosyltransferase involved in cell wall biosynthesis
LDRCITLLRALLDREQPTTIEVIFAANGCTDNSISICEALCKADSRFRLISTNGVKGRGAALSAAWQETSASIVSYMDVDIATDLECLPALLTSVCSDEADLTVGSRFHPQSRVHRELSRRIVGRAYSWLIRALFRTGVNDFQCGFKAFRKGPLLSCLPLVRDRGWFFDTELLLIAERKGFRIKEIPIIWNAGKESKVRLPSSSFHMTLAALKLRASIRRRLIFTKSAS